MRTLHKFCQWFQEFLAEPLRRVDTESREFLAKPDSRRIDREVIAALVTAASMLTIQEYFVTNAGENLVDHIIHLFCPQTWDDAIRQWADREENHEIAKLGRWTLGNFIVYIAGPLLVIKVFLRKRIGDYGASFERAHLIKGWPIYVGMFLIMLPFIFLASRMESFQSYYPFYHLREGEPLWPRFITWEILYAFQFIALEFFFRGFLVHAMKKRFGVYSIFVAAVPYCMIHFDKPMPETFGAIAAGIALGFMSLKTRSIWLGAALHISVAWTMDTIAVFRIMSN